MNVMAKAHKAAKTAKALGSVIAYRELFRVALKQAHKEYKAMTNSLQTAFRNMYKVIDTTAKQVVGFVTATNDKDAIEKYRKAGGAAGYLATQQVSSGYPEEVCNIIK